jgi:UDP-glucuronate 4-epimerase
LGSQKINYLITGAYGFVGAHLSRHLAQLGHSVVGIDNCSTYYHPGLKLLRKEYLLANKRITLSQLDLAQRTEIEAVFKDQKFDIVIHLAAQAGVRTPEHSNYQYVQNNLVAFQNVMQSAVNSGIRTFLYASSSSVYGNSTNAPYSENEANLKPISFYGMTKLMNEMMARLSTEATDAITSMRAMRFFTVYGPWGRPDMAYLRLINSAQSGKMFHLLGSGEAMRDFTYIDDVVQSIYMLSQELHSNPIVTNDIINIGIDFREYFIIIMIEAPVLFDKFESLALLAVNK